MKDNKKFADLIVGIAIIVIGVIFFTEAATLPTQARGIGTGDYPRFVCILLFILGAAQIIKSVIGGFPRPDFKNVEWKKLLKSAVAMLLLFIYYRFVKKVGFLLLTPVLLYGLLLLYGYPKKIKGLIITVLFTTSVYFLFVKVFMVLLPRGILG